MVLQPLASIEEEVAVFDNKRECILLSYIYIIVSATEMFSLTFSNFYIYLVPGKGGPRLQYLFIPPFFYSYKSLTS